METHLLFTGLIIGFSIAAPVGPIGVLCIRRTLAFGPVSGLLSGLGAASADAVYGAMAAFGLTFVSAMLVNQQEWLKLVGGLFLCYLGVATLLAPPSSPDTAGEQNLAGDYASTFFLTLTNPATILSFAAIFAGLGLGSQQRDYLSAGLMVLGVFSGSALWWLTLSSLVGLFRKKLTGPGLRWVNRISGLIIAGFGAAILLSMLV
jgi:threonine/homoserine/homoserine lactone efflux protein